jgi:hypothetical protein
MKGFTYLATAFLAVLPARGINPTEKSRLK